MTTQGPRLVAWETTRRCPLGCRHCRGSARNTDYAGELSTAEAVKLIDAVAAFSSPILILTGGEPMMRDDIYGLAAHATTRGLHVVMSPCGPMIDPEAARRIRDSGIRRISISLDGSDARTHDAFRGAAGAFDAALRGIRFARDAGIEVQIHTTVTRSNAAHLPAILEMAAALGAVAFGPFFLVPVGRGDGLRGDELSALEYDRWLGWVFESSRAGPLAIRPTCAPQYQRICRQSAAGSGTATPRPGGPPAAARGCMAGDGFVFVSHRGIVQGCGFLDVPCGDLRQADFDLRRIYETSEVFLKLRDPDGYHGKCGVCEYRRVCGGCRARARAHSGDYLGEEPLCSYVPGKTP